MAVQLTAVLFALRREARPFLRLLRGVEKVRAAPCPAWRAEGDVLVLVTGMGRAATERAMDWLLEQQPQLVVSAGYCGSLSADVAVGEVCQPHRIVRPDGEAWTLRHEPLGRPEVLVSVDRPVTTIQDRLDLHQQTHARIVDMESAAVVRRCQAAGVACRCLRVVSDDFASSLPADLVPAFSGEHVHYRALLRAVCRRPNRILDLCRLARHTQRASYLLAEALQRLLADG